MKLRLDNEEMKKLAKGNHSTGKVASVLPFRANDKGIKLDGDFKNIIGEFSRLIHNQGLKNETEPLVTKETSANYITGEITIAQKIIENVNADEQSSKDDLQRLLETILSDRQGNNIIRPIHPHIFLYYPLSENKTMRNFEKKISEFTKDTIGIDPKNIASVFKKGEDDDLLIRLILDNLENLKERKMNKQYQLLNSTVVDLFQKDFIYMSRHREFFLDHAELLFHYYLIFYTSQVAIHFHQFEKGDHSTIYPLYFGLDWETLSKRRPSISDTFSYKSLRDRFKSTFVHVHCQSQLSHVMNDTYNSENLKFLTYHELNNLFENDEERNDFTESLNTWLETYCDLRKLNFEGPINSPEEGYTQLFNYLREGMSTVVCENYGKSMENIIHGQFLKFRGSLGFSFNVTQEFLILMTALVTQNHNKMTLKEYFNGLEDRGIKFDQYSKEKVVNLLDSINIIEKKSDSGDAQYVKSIL